MGDLGCRSKNSFFAITAVTLAVALILAGPGSSLLSAQVQTFQCAAPGFGPVVAAPPILLTSLKTVQNPVFLTGVNGPVRADLTDYIASQAAAIQLGKALFWDMQAG